MSKGDLVELGQQLYDERLKVLLEPKHVGRFVAIDPNTGRYFVGDTGSKALTEARAVIPKGLFYLMRIGYRATDALSCSLK